MKLNGVQMGVEDAEKMAEFYKAVFGEPKWSMGDGWYGWEIGTGFLFFGPHSEVKGTAVEPQRVMIAIESSDVAADFTKIIEAGGTEVAKPYKPDPNNSEFWQATVADPEGNYLQLASPFNM